MPNVTRLEAVPLRVIDDQSADGRGGVVEIPLAVATHGIRTQKTSGGGDGSMDGDASVFAEIVRNFSSVPGPVPVYFGHIPDSDRRTTPAAGYVESVWLENDRLWGRVSLGQSAWIAVVAEQGFRSFSVEIERDLSTPASDLDGWALTGGSITNRPALDVEYVAASADARGQETARFAFEAAGAEYVMSEDIAKLRAEMEQHKSEIETLKAENAALEAKLETAGKEADAEKVSLEKRIDRLTAAMESLQKSLDTANADKVELQRQKDAATLEQEIKDAIDGGVPAVMFEGFDEADDKLKWCDEAFGGVKSLRASIERVPKATPGKKDVSAGKVEADGKDAEQAYMEAVTAHATEKSIPFHEAEDYVQKTKPDTWRAFKAARLGE